jgi:hypothetical protein
MNDDQIEDLLRRVRPAGPPPRLRARIISARRPVPRAWPWVSAAAALLVLTVALPLYDGRGQQALASAPSAWDAERSLLTDLFGGDREAERFADQIVSLNELRAGAVPTPPAAANPEVQ